MTMPNVNRPTLDVYSTLEPWTLNDESKGWPLLQFMAATGTMFQQLDQLINTGPNGEDGWSILLDVNRVPTGMLPYLGQFVGVRYLGGDLESMRERIRTTDGFKRGTPAALIGAGQAYLTGTKTVYLQERRGSAYRFDVATLYTETPETDWDLDVNTLKNPDAVGTAADLAVDYVSGGGALPVTGIDAVSAPPYGGLTLALGFSSSASMNLDMGISDLVSGAVAGNYFALSVDKVTNTSIGLSQNLLVQLVLICAGGTPSTISSSVYTLDKAFNSSILDLRLFGTIPPGTTSVTKRLYVTQAGGGSMPGGTGVVVSRPKFTYREHKPYTSVVYSSGNTSEHLFTGTVNASSSQRSGLTTLTRDAFLSQKPAGLVMNYEIVDTWTFDTLNEKYATFDAVQAAFATFDDVTNNTPL